MGGEKIQRVGCENGRRGHRRKGEGDGGQYRSDLSRFVDGDKPNEKRDDEGEEEKRRRREERRGGLRKQLAKMIPWSKRWREEKEKKKKE